MGGCARDEAEAARHISSCEAFRARDMVAVPKESAEVSFCCRLAKKAFRNSGLNASLVRHQQDHVSARGGKLRVMQRMEDVESRTSTTVLVSMYVPESRVHRPVVDTCASEAIPPNVGSWDWSLVCTCAIFLIWLAASQELHLWHFHCALVVGSLHPT